MTVTGSATAYAAAVGSRRVLPGLAVTTLGVVGALIANAAVPSVGVLPWAVVLGAAAANLGLLPESTAPGLQLAVRRLLRVGVVLLGFSLSLVSIAALGAPVVALVGVTLVSTLLATTWLGLRLGMGRPRSLLIGAGFAICGASAIAAIEQHAEADDDDVAAAIAMVTLCGTVAMVGLPLLQSPLGLSATQYGVWAGASVHEVGQVVAAAGPAGAAAVSVAVVTKLTRVLFLAPVVAGVSLLRRRRPVTATPTDAAGGAGSARPLPPVVPVFVVGFLCCVVLRSTGLVPMVALSAIGHLQTLAFGAALFAMGTGVRFGALLRGSAPALVLATASTVVVAGVSLAGVLLVA